MFEITREMLEQALGEERRKREKINENVNKFIPPCLIVFGVLSVIIFFFAPVGVSFGTKLLRWSGMVLMIVIIGIIAFFIYFAKQNKMGVIDVIKGTFLGKQYSDALKLEFDDKIRWLKSALAKAKTPYEKLNAICFLIQVYAEKCMENEVDEYFNMLSQIIPKKTLDKIMFLDIQLLYYDYKDDTENYLRTYSENDNILKLKWDMTLSEQIGVFNRYMNYVFINRDYQKALELYNLNLEIHEKAAEIDVNFALPEESKNLYCIDYAMLYCKLGEKEKAAESFRVALERNSNTDKPYIKKHIEKVRGMLNEAGVDYSTAT